MPKETGNRLLRARLRIGLTRLPELTELFFNSLLVRMLVTLCIRHSPLTRLKPKPSILSPLAVKLGPARIFLSKMLKRAGDRIWFARLQELMMLRSCGSDPAKPLFGLLVRMLVTLVSNIQRSQGLRRSFGPSRPLAVHLAGRVFFFRRDAEKMSAIACYARGWESGSFLYLSSTLTGVRRSVDPLFARN